MCVNYQPEPDSGRWQHQFGLFPPDMPWPPETWPGYAAPFIRRADTAEHRREACIGIYGLVPHWAKDLTIARSTYNSRSETSATKPSFRDAWKHGRRCIVPAESIYEPCWETGKAVRWRVQAVDGEPIGIAGLWASWRAPDGRDLLSFTMLTVNADDHPLMRRLHKPTDEKRMVVILEPADYDRWLDAPVPDMPAFMTRYPADLLVAEPAPLPPRRPQAP